MLLLGILKDILSFFQQRPLKTKRCFLPDTPSLVANLYLTSLPCFWNLRSTELLLHLSSACSILRNKLAGITGNTSIAREGQVAQACAAAWAWEVPSFGVSRSVARFPAYALRERTELVSSRMSFSLRKIWSVWFTDSNPNIPLFSVGKLDLTN